MLHPEHELVPFEVSPLPPGPWLVFAPHADDETFGMGGTLLQARRQGIAAHVIVLTDGALGGVVGEAGDLVAVRRNEIARAGQLLGLAGLQLWSEPDRGLEHSEGLESRVQQAITELTPAAVFFPGPLEIHPDHRATAFIVWQALQRAYAAHCKPRIIAYEIGMQNPVNLFIDITAVRAEKQRVMAIYASQNSENNYPDLVLSLNKARTFSLPASIEYAEGFYQFSEQDLQCSLREMTHRIIDRYQ